MPAPLKEMGTYLARLMSFAQPQQLAKRRRASSNTSKRKAANTVTWPHENPPAEALARAGFFYKPLADSDDNVQCFHCSVKLDGWEETDDAMLEHLAHTDYCAWAVAVSVSRTEDSEREPEMRDPLCDELVTARKTTFQTSEGWPHENKKAWKCKRDKLVEAGWCYDPSPEVEEADGVSCFYCNLSLDGWEPKDDPLEEHRRRAPHCRFFQLLELHHGSSEPPKKGKARSKARGSAASKASRISTQSVLTAASEALSAGESLGDIPLHSSLAGVDDSILTAGTTASTATATKGKKKIAKAKAPSKATKGRKKASQEEELGAQYPDLAQVHATEDEDAPPVPPKSPQRTERSSRQIVDSSVIEISAIEAAPAKKATRGRKPKAQPRQEPDHETEVDVPQIPQTPDADEIAQKRLGEVSMQLQGELELSVDEFAEDLDQSTPIVVEASKPKRGIKRNSGGSRKQQESSIAEPESAAGEQIQPTAKAKRARKPKQASTDSPDVATEVATETQPTQRYEDRIEIDIPFVSQDAEADDENSQPNKAKMPAKKGKARPKGKKSSSTRTSKTAASEAEPEQATLADEEEDLAKDEMEIEQELERMAAEQASQQAEAVQAEQELVEEFEPSPSQGRTSKDSNDFSQLQEEVDAETIEPEASNQQLVSSSRQSLRKESRMPGGFTPSPNGSDKENLPSSAFQPVTAQKAPAVILSPTKSTRIPLAGGTPNKRSPAKSMLSPSKQVSGLVSSAPWTAMDIDAVLAFSPQASPGKVGAQLVAAAGVLTSPEKKMTVEEWIRHRAAQSEAELRSKCERLVEAFEREGMRAMEALNGIKTLD